MEKITSIGLAEFAHKHFPVSGEKNPMFSLSHTAFLDFVNQALGAGSESCNWFDSQEMSFCKYLFFPNFTSAYPSHLRIDNSNAQWLRSAYEARTKKELPVLTRWLDLPVKPDPAAWLMLILYSREQLLKEGAVPTHDWNTISIIALNEKVVPPMPPITVMRNELGVDAGGNGQPIDRHQYGLSVDYWEKHAVVR